MTVAASLPPDLLGIPLDGPGVRFTVGQFYRMYKAGIFTEEDRNELLAGQIVAKGPISPAHASCVWTVSRYLEKRLAGAYMAFTTGPLPIPQLYSEPEPDVVVVAYRQDAWAHRHPEPSDLLLVVEVSDETLRRDRTTKARIYAAAGIREYWIVNLVNRQLERHLLPTGAKRYPKPTIVAEGERFTHALIGEVAVAELLPEACT